MLGWFKKEKQEPEWKPLYLPFGVFSAKQVGSHIVIVAGDREVSAPMEWRALTPHEFYARIVALMAGAFAWRSASIDPPEIGEAVIAHDGAHSYCAMLTGSGWVSLEEYDKVADSPDPLDGVLEWMPLPAPRYQATGGGGDG